MKPMLRVLSLLLTVAMLLALCACGDDGDKDKKDGKDGKDNAAAEADDDSDAFIFKDFENEEVVELGKPESPIDPEEVYSKIEYDERMFYGHHTLRGGDEAAEKLPSEVGCYPEYKDEYNNQVSLFPYQLTAGRHSMAHKCYAIKEYDWCKLDFKTPEGYISSTYPCAYMVEGHTIRIYPVDVWEYNEETSTIRYSLSDFCFEYEFEFKGLDLILKKDGKSVTLSTGFAWFTDEEYPLINVDGYAAQPSEAIEGIGAIFMRQSKETPQEAKEARFIIEKETHFDDIYNGCAKLTHDGVFTMTVPWESGTKTYQYVCFYCDEDGMVLTDGDNYYYYNYDWSDVSGDALGDTITIEDAEKLKNMDEEKLQEIVEKKNDLAADLVEAFKKVGIAVKVNATTGEISMDSTVLFGGDSSTITAEGEKVLQKFISTYTTVILDQKYEGFISKIMVEGHTAPVNNNSYEDGLPLSQERADKVKAYCCSDKAGLSADAKAKISDMMQAVGMSNSDPIKDADGNVDMAASRRVCFRFIVNLE